MTQNELQRIVNELKGIAATLRATRDGKTAEEKF